MHGLIFVTWEKYLAERFGSSLLNDYRHAIGEVRSRAVFGNSPRRQEDWKVLRDTGDLGEGAGRIRRRADLR